MVYHILIIPVSAEGNAFIWVGYNITELFMAFGFWAAFNDCGQKNFYQKKDLTHFLHPNRFPVDIFHQPGDYGSHIVNCVFGFRRLPHHQ